MTACFSQSRPKSIQNRQIIYHKSITHASLVSTLCCYSCVSTFYSNDQPPKPLKSIKFIVCVYILANAALYKWCYIHSQSLSQLGFLLTPKTNKQTRLQKPITLGIDIVIYFFLRVSVDLKCILQPFCVVLDRLVVPKMGEGCKPMPCRCDFVQFSTLRCLSDWFIVGLGSMLYRILTNVG